MKTVTMVACALVGAFLGGCACCFTGVLSGKCLGSKLGDDGDDEIASVVGGLVGAGAGLALGGVGGYKWGMSLCS